MHFMNNNILHWRLSVLVFPRNAYMALLEAAEKERNKRGFEQQWSSLTNWYFYMPFLGVFSALKDILSSGHEEDTYAATGSFKSLMHSCIDESLIKQGFDQIPLNLHTSSRKSSPTIIEKKLYDLEPPAIIRKAIKQFENRDEFYSTKNSKICQRSWTVSLIVSSSNKSVFLLEVSTTTFSEHVKANTLSMSGYWVDPTGKTGSHESTTLYSKVRVGQLVSFLGC
ncbi:hypothetical protein K1719_034729 [Acacia pycnantha]|nr:hypothetical protein K1719_034729 [Acacia pycnantha]